MDILIIDDDESVRNAFLLALRKGDYQLHTADSGETGVASARQFKPELIFLDLKMKGLNGLETLLRIRTSGIESRVFIVTAFAPEYLKDLADASAQKLDFSLLQKPLSADQIRLIAEDVNKHP